MATFWDEKFNTEDFIYGKEPNDFVKEKLDQLMPGKVLFPAEGEGRNAVYAAKSGWTVSAFDTSEVAKQKAEKLASDKNVKINYSIEGYEEFSAPLEYFDAIVYVFAHSAPAFNAHTNFLKYLKKGGVIILEGFTKKQLGYKSGGPQNIDMLYDEEQMRSEFSALSEIDIQVGERTLNEGDHHNGPAHTIRLFGIK
jgi:cyclopropane fatty-acyl-phospholipid synthase-like methyltransferase